jgi:FixJ family two-component response regulator
MSVAHTVYVIEDELSVRTGLMKLLRLLGLPAREYSTADAFLADFDGTAGCLLLDLRLPGMSGLDLLAELERRGQSMPVIVMTGHTDIKAVQRVEAFRPLGFLEKPFSFDDLKALIARWQAAIEGAERV